MTVRSLYGMIPFLLSVGLALACALTFKLWHKRQLRRAPLQGRKLGHLPGQQLLQRIEHHDTEILTAVMLMYFALPLMFMLWVGFKLDLARIRWSTTETILLVGAVGLFLYGFFDYVRNYRARQKYHDGLAAERVTGMQLNRLAAQGCIVLHDLPCEEFNIDHVVIAPRGIYAVETKSFRKPKDASGDRRGPGHEVRYDGKTLMFPDFATREPIEQAARQAQWLRRRLRDALQTEYPVIAAVALPGWYVVRSDEGKRAEVQVFTPMGKGAEFMAWEPQRVDQTQRCVIAETLAARYPTLEN